MKKIIAILFMMLMCVGTNAQVIKYVPYSKELAVKAEGGDGEAMFDLGNCYFWGNGITKDLSEAVYWYNKGAEKGNSAAMFGLGYCYQFGEGVLQDYTKAFYWLKKASENGNVMAMNNLGLCYEQGKGVARNYSQAVYWWKKGAENGGSASISNLGLCYQYGKDGFLKDQSKAEILFSAKKKAEDGDTQGAMELVYQVFPEMAMNGMYADVPEPATILEPEEVIEPEKVLEPEETDVPADNVPVMASSDVDANIPNTGKSNENTFAVIIANENYMEEDKVLFALNDGKVFATYCRQVLGLPEENIRVINDATLNQMRGGVNWLKKVADAYNGDASLIFYYAGHGVPDEKSKDAYLLPADGYGNDLITAYKMEDLYTRLSSCPSRRTLVFLDACFSGAQRSGKMMASARAVGISVKKTAPKGNMVVFTAAQGDETAYPYEDKKHGMFTYFLLKKLQQSKGNVTLGELGSYIKTNVMKKSVVTNSKSQTPSVQPSPTMINTWKDIRF